MAAKKTATKRAAKKTAGQTASASTAVKTKESVAMAVAMTALTKGVAAQFNSMRARTDMQWNVEKMYALQLINRSDKLQEAVRQSPHTLVTALLDVSRLGLTLAPSRGLVYLIPQRPTRNDPPEIHAKVSYRGMEQAVLNSGTVSAIQTELVYKNDKLRRGVDRDGSFVEFEMARGDRGELEGGFCFAQYANGKRHVEWMSIEEIDACEAAAIKANFGETPFTWRGGFRGEMQKKCIVRRAQKHWPSDKIIDAVMQQFDSEEPMSFTEDNEAVVLFGKRDIVELRKELPKLSSEQQDVWFQRKAEAMGYDSINDVPQSMFDKVRNDLSDRYKKVVDRESANG